MSNTVRIECPQCGMPQLVDGIDYNDVLDEILEHCLECGQRLLIETKVNVEIKVYKVEVIKNVVSKP